MEPLVEDPDAPRAWSYLLCDPAYRAAWRGHAGAAGDGGAGAEPLGACLRTRPSPGAVAEGREHRHDRLLIALDGMRVGPEGREIAAGEAVIDGAALRPRNRAAEGGGAGNRPENLSKTMKYTEMNTHIL